MCETTDIHPSPYTHCSPLPCPSIVYLPYFILNLINTIPVLLLCFSFCCPLFDFVLTCPFFHYHTTYSLVFRESVWRIARTSTQPHTYQTEAQGVAFTLARKAFRKCVCVCVCVSVSVCMCVYCRGSKARKVDDEFGISWERANHNM